MKRKISVRKPHRSGRCAQCIGRLRNVCKKCPRFVNQDVIPQRCFLMSQNDLVRLHDKTYFGIDMPGFGSLKERQETNSHFQKNVAILFKEASLSHRQRQIVRLLVFERRTYFWISERLGISKGCVREQALRARKKILSCITPALLSEGEIVSILKEWAASTRDTQHNDNKNSPAIQSMESSENEVEANGYQESFIKKALCLRRVCPRCADKAFSIGREFQYCMSCTWNSDQERSNQQKRRGAGYAHVSHARAYL